MPNEVSGKPAKILHEPKFPFADWDPSVVPPSPGLISHMESILDVKENERHKVRKGSALK